MNLDRMEKDYHYKYLKLLSKKYPTVALASSEIAHLSAMLELPKASEHFLSDIHGEYEAFSHVLRNGSGIVRKRIELIFGEVLEADEQKSLAALIYYPEAKFDLEQKKWGEEHFRQWLMPRIYQMLDIAQSFAKQYSKRQINSAFHSEFGSILDELIHSGKGLMENRIYYNSLIASIIDSGQAKGLISDLAGLIQHLAIGKLHVIGDVYDRGPGAERIMDMLLDYHSVDFQWGNHDIIWMGAAAGSWACMANVLRVSLRYNNLDTLEDGYGISLLPLATFALETYKGDANKNFMPKLSDEEENKVSDKDIHLMQIMQKAITIIQLKLEGQIISRRKEFRMKNRMLLHHIDQEKGTVKIGKKVYPLEDSHFPTVDRKNAYELTTAEREVMEKIANSFLYSEKLQKHTRFLYEHGGMHLVYNNNLLIHGCIPLNSKGDFASFHDGENYYQGKALVERFDSLARQAYLGGKDLPAKQYGQDMMWYLWCGALSPVFGKKKMATFESYFISDKSAKQESKNAYYKLRNQRKTCAKILKEFGLNPDTSHILNGHVPVVVKKGESPVKAKGKLIVIDGGFAKAYQDKTGIAGYTLISDTDGLQLVSHRPFESNQKAIKEELDILSYETILETPDNPIKVRETDEGKRIKEKILDLEALVSAYKEGVIK